MKKTILFTAVIGIIAITSFAFAVLTPEAKKSSNNLHALREPTLWKADKVHSMVKFSVTHLLVSEVDGSFKLFEGTMETSKPDFSDAKINFTVDINSLSTDNENRDSHLKSDDFFNAEKYPSIKFEGTSFTPLGENKYKLEGNLTIRDVTKPVTFDVVYGGMANAMGSTRAGFKAKTTINRFDYNLKWDKATEAGGLVVSKEVDITVNVEMVKS
ncbi:MAG: YceI family protein [Parafilimonas sp.]